MTNEATLNAIAAEAAVCTRCKLHGGRTRAVPGEGPADAEFMFIGEGPGFHEDQQGRPFVGAAGQFLEELLALIGLKRAQVFITNVIKCRPPQNRDPQPDELAACDDYLERQIAALSPRVIITLGRFSMARFFPNAKISAIHGQAQRVNGRLVVAMFHPAAALHQPKFRDPLIEDFKKLRTVVAQAERAPAAKPADAEPPAEQLSLF
jgi:DNA polymerase